MRSGGRRSRLRSIRTGTRPRWVGRWTGGDTTPAPAQFLAEGARLTAVGPGVTRHGDDVGRRLAAQRRNWDRLNTEQQRRLGELGVDWAAG